MTVHVSGPGGAIEGATVTFQRSTRTWWTPGPFSGSSVTDLAGEVDFVVFVHDTDTFTFTANADGFRERVVVFGDGLSLGGLQLSRAGGRVDMNLQPD